MFRRGVCKKNISWKRSIHKMLFIVNRSRVDILQRVEAGAGCLLIPRVLARPRPPFQNSLKVGMVNILTPLFTEQLVKKSWTSPGVRDRSLMGKIFEIDRENPGSLRKRPLTKWRRSWKLHSGCSTFCVHFDGSWPNLKSLPPTYTVSDKYEICRG
jgi:hypothetical protein